MKIEERKRIHDEIGGVSERFIDDMLSLYEKFMDEIEFVGGILLDTVVSSSFLQLMDNLTFIYYVTLQGSC